MRLFFVHSAVLFTFSVLISFVNIWRFFTSHFVGAKRRLRFSQINGEKKLTTIIVGGFYKNEGWQKTEREFKYRKTEQSIKLWPSYKRFDHHSLPCRKKDPSGCRENFHELASFHFKSKIFFIYAKWTTINLDISLQVCLLQPIFFKKTCATRKFPWNLSELAAMLFHQISIESWKHFIARFEWK